MCDGGTVISSERLDLVSLPAAFLRASLERDTERAEALLGFHISPEWYERRSTIEMRLGQIERDPSLQPWLLRTIVLRSEALVVGHIGFHTAPGPNYLSDLAPGGVEFGYSVYPAYRRRGIAREAARALMAWATREHGVTTFVVSIRPDNVPSQRLAQQLGFARIGGHIDPVDGPEDILVLRVGEDG